MTSLSFASEDVNFACIGCFTSFKPQEAMLRFESELADIKICENCVRIAARLLDNHAGIAPKREPKATVFSVSGPEPVKLFGLYKNWKST